MKILFGLFFLLMNVYSHGEELNALLPQAVAMLERGSDQINREMPLQSNFETETREKVVKKSIEAVQKASPKQEPPKAVEPKGISKQDHQKIVAQTKSDKSSKMASQSQKVEVPKKETSVPTVKNSEGTKPANAEIAKKIRESNPDDPYMALLPDSLDPKEWGERILAKQMEEIDKKMANLPQGGEKPPTAEEFLEKKHQETRDWLKKKFGVPDNLLPTNWDYTPFEIRADGSIVDGGVDKPEWQKTITGPGYSITYTIINGAFWVQAKGMPPEDLWPPGFTKEDFEL